jgi:hypothetical protein
LGSNIIWSCFSIGNFITSKKKYVFEGQKAESKPWSPNSVFGLKNQYDRVKYLSIGNFIWSKKNFYFGTKIGENKPQSPKTEIGLQNQYVRLTLSSIGNFIWSKYNYAFAGQIDENKPLEPKFRFCVKKSVWSCEISIAREFYMEKKYTFGGQIGKNMLLEPKNGILPQNHYSMIFIDQKIYITQLNMMTRNSKIFSHTPKALIHWIISFKVYLFNFCPLLRASLKKCECDKHQ